MIAGYTHQKAFLLVLVGVFLRFIPRKMRFWDLIGDISCLKSVSNPDNTDELSFSQFARYTCLVNNPLVAPIIPTKMRIVVLVGIVWGLLKF